MASPSALVGFAIDVSGSMKESFDNRSSSNKSNMSEFRAALDSSMERLSKSILSASNNPDSDSSSSLIFIYAYGLSQSPEIVDVLGMLDNPHLIVSEVIKAVVTPARLRSLKAEHTSEYRRKSTNWRDPMGSTSRLYDASIGGRMAVREIRDSIVADLANETRKRFAKQNINVNPSKLINRLANPIEPLVKNEQWDDIPSAIESELRSEIERYERTMSLTELARKWKTSKSFFDDSNDNLFGRTPMRQCLQRIIRRFEKESKSLSTNIPKILVLVTDGQPTDGKIDSEIRQLKALGIRIISCFITNSDLGTLDRLYASPSSHWSKPAHLMFESASVIDDDPLFGEVLQTNGWTIEENARFFVHANHSKILEKFFSSVFERYEGVYQK